MREHTAMFRKQAIGGGTERLLDTRVDRIVSPGIASKWENQI